MIISTTHKVITIPFDPLLDLARDDNKRDLLVKLHSIDNPSDMICIRASSESRVLAIRSGRMFSIELRLAQLELGDMVNIESEKSGLAWFLSLPPPY